MKPDISAIQALSTSARIFRKEWKPLLAAAAAFYAPMSAAEALIPASLKQSVANIYAAWASTLQGGAGVTQPALGEGAVTSAVLYVAVEFALLSLFAGMAAGAAGHVVSASLNERPVDVMEMLNKTISRAPKYAATLFALYLVSALLSPLVAPVIYLSVAAGLTAYVINDTGAWGVTAVLESLRLNRRKWWRTCLFLIVVVGLEFFLTMFIPYSPLAAVNAVINAAWNFFCFLFVMATAILYEDRKRTASETGEPQS